MSDFFPFPRENQPARHHCDVPGQMFIDQYGNTYLLLRHYVNTLDNFQSFQRMCIVLANVPMHSQDSFIEHRPYSWYVGMKRINQ